MDTEEPQGGGLPRGLILSAIVGILAVAGLVGYLMFATPGGPPIDIKVNGGGLPISARESPVDNARDTLKRVTDVNAARGALQQINSHLTEDSKSRPTPLDEKSRAALQLLLELREDELAEAASVNFTKLDPHHLEACFLFRDAGEAVRIGAVGVQTDGTRIARTPLERAAAGFGWTCRQVRLTPGEGEPVPPQYALRRGSGSALERALVFLALLDGLGGDDGRLDGCLLWVRDEPAKPPRLWACGVLVEGSTAIHLFDPRLGLPLPGPNDQGIATLAAIRKDPALLNQLTIGDAQYDVTPTQAANAELTLVCPLSAASPRMRHLQDKLLPPLRVSLANDVPEELERWKTAVAALGNKLPPVRVWPDGVILLRRFLPEEEGGSDTVRAFPVRLLPGYSHAKDQTNEPMTRKRLFELTLVPWGNFPDILRDSSRFPGGLGRVIRDAFSRPFVRSAIEPGQPRDQMLRGDYRNAPVPLVQERDRMRRRLEAFQTEQADLLPRIDAWAQEAIRTYALLLRTKPDGTPAANPEQALKELWGKAAAVETLLGGALAGPRGAEATWLLGLCKQEEAERKQARLDLLTRAGIPVLPADAADARANWKEAGNWWMRYAEDYPIGPALAAVRRLHARTESALGRTDAARTLIDDVSAPMTLLEKLACRIESRRLKK